MENTLRMSLPLFKLIPKLEKQLSLLSSGKLPKNRFFTSPVGINDRNMYSIYINIVLMQIEKNSVARMPICSISSLFLSSLCEFFANVHKWASRSSIRSGAGKSEISYSLILIHNKNIFENIPSCSLFIKKNHWSPTFGTPLIIFGWFVENSIQCE